MLNNKPILTITGSDPAGVSGVQADIRTISALGGYAVSAITSLTIQNSCSSEFTLTTMAIVSILIPFVLAYIWHAWWSIDQKKLDIMDITDDHAY